MRYRWEITEKRVQSFSGGRTCFLCARPLNGGQPTTTKVSRRWRKGEIGSLPARPYRVSFEGYDNICRARIESCRGVNVGRRAWSVAK